MILYSDKYEAVTTLLVQPLLPLPFPPSQYDPNPELDQSLPHLISPLPNPNISNLFPS